MNITAIRKKVLSDIRPPVSAALDAFISEFSSYVDATLYSGGSYAKDTHIGTSFDCDIFVMFDPKKYSGDKISKVLEKAVIRFSKDKKLSYRLIHGSRKYFRVLYEGISFELVPVLAIESPDQAENIMDHSPFHVKWFLSANGKEYSDDIRLLKQFFKANRVYGAESYIGGFSGHVTDILVLHYKGFASAIKAIASWSKTTTKSFKKVILDVPKSYTGKDVLFYMNESKTHAPVIVVDPVLPDRNAAAALSDDCFNRAIDAARAFVKKPSETFFVEKMISVPGAVTIEAKPVAGDLDTSGAKLKKALEHIVARLHHFGFSVDSYDWEWRTLPAHATFFITAPKKIAATFEHVGPPVALESAAVAFKKKYPAAKAKKGVLVVTLHRKFVLVDDCLKEILSEKYVLERVSAAIIR